ncbi:VOC family protein [Streptomyces sp. NPDC127033]|uniref:VOC family protein n=1 Tax=Streptomyces sp. NPDC127033 TaxID=3347110 RepID=UPI0036621B99
MTPADTRTASVADRVRTVDHIGIAVPSVAEAVPLFVDLLGGRFLSGGDNDERGIRLLHLALGQFKIELLQPLRADAAVAAFLDGRGPGFHHLTLFVDDVPQTVEALAASGYAPTGTDTASPRWSETFLPPRATFGTLLQFTSTTTRWDVPAQDYGLRDVLAGRVVWRDYVACLRDDG